MSENWPPMLRDTQLRFVERKHSNANVKREMKRRHSVGRTDIGAAWLFEWIVYIQLSLPN